MDSAFINFIMNLYLFMTLGLLDKYKDKDVLIDEGLGQVLWAFYYNSKDSIEAINGIFDILFHTPRSRRTDCCNGYRYADQGRHHQ